MRNIFKFFGLFVLVFMLSGCKDITMTVSDKFVVDKISSGAVEQYEIKQPGIEDGNSRYINPEFRMRISYTYNNIPGSIVCSVNEGLWNMINVGYTFNGTAISADIDCSGTKIALSNSLTQRQ